MSEQLEVGEPAKLLAYLRANLDTWSVRTLKMRLRLSCITVNGEVATRHDHPLKAGDVVDVKDKEGGHGLRFGSTKQRPAFKTIYVDDDLIAIDKPAGLLSVATDEGMDRNALALVRESLSTPREKASLWPVHRLDRQTSGVLLFARSRDVCNALHDVWTEVDKTYLAIVEGHPEPTEGTIDQPLWEDPGLFVRVGSRPGSRDARTHFTTKERTSTRSLLSVKLETGRRHQIRVHLASLGHPVVGDKRYGTSGRRLGLHSLQLIIPHPRNDTKLTFDAAPPRAFFGLLKDKDKDKD